MKKLFAHGLLFCFISAAFAQDYTATAMQENKAAVDWQPRNTSIPIVLEDTGFTVLNTTNTLTVDAMPFNSKRIDLINSIGSLNNSVMVNGQMVKLLRPKLVAEFYRSQSFPTIWTLEDKITPIVKQLQDLINQSANDALNPALYHQSFINNLQLNQPYPDIIGLEILMTDAYLTLADHLANGVVSAQKMVPTWNAPKVDSSSLSNMLAQSIIKQDIISDINALNANNPYYQRLKADYNALKNTQDVTNLVISMERLRWMPQNWGDRYIIVNIPSFEVFMVQGGHEIYRTRSVVGSPARPTPQFIDNLRHIVFSPTWTVPPTIMKQDKLKLLRNDPYRFDGNYEVIIGGQTYLPSEIDWHSAGAVNYTLRQKTGQSNPLGKVKFLFPNKHAIYLHDTDNKGLFKQKNRARSSGCIRLQDPIDLANLLLAGTRWDASKIDEATKQTKEQWVNPPQSTPIYLVYWTTWVDASGVIHHSNDIYKLNDQLANAYQKALTLSNGN